MLASLKYNDGGVFMKGSMDFLTGHTYVACMGALLKQIDSDIHLTQYKKLITDTMCSCGCDYKDVDNLLLSLKNYGSKKSFVVKDDITIFDGKSYTVGTGELAAAIHSHAAFTDRSCDMFLRDNVGNVNACSACPYSKKGVRSNKYISLEASIIRTLYGSNVGEINFPDNVTTNTKRLKTFFSSKIDIFAWAFDLRSKTVIVPYTNDIFCKLFAAYFKNKGAVTTLDDMVRDIISSMRDNYSDVIIKQEGWYERTVDYIIELIMSVPPIEVERLSEFDFFKGLADKVIDPASLFSGIYTVVADAQHADVSSQGCNSSFMVTDMDADESSSVSIAVGSLLSGNCSAVRIYDDIDGTGSDNSDVNGVVDSIADSGADSVADSGNYSNDMGFVSSASNSDETCGMAEHDEEFFKSIVPSYEPDDDELAETAQVESELYDKLYDGVYGDGVSGENEGRIIASDDVSSDSDGSGKELQNESYGLSVIFDINRDKIYRDYECVDDDVVYNAVKESADVFLDKVACGDYVFQFFINKVELDKLAWYACENISSISRFEESTYVDGKLFLEAVRDENGVEYILLWNNHLHRFWYLCPSVDASEYKDIYMPILTRDGIVKVCCDPYSLMSVCRKYGMRLRNVVSITTAHFYVTKVLGLVKETSCGEVSFSGMLSCYCEPYDVGDFCMIEKPVGNKGWSHIVYSSLFRWLPRYVIVYRVLGSYTMDKRGSSGPDMRYLKLCRLDEALGVSYDKSQCLWVESPAFSIAKPGDVSFISDDTKYSKLDGYIVRYQVLDGERGVNTVAQKNALVYEVLCALVESGKFRNYDIFLLNYSRGSTRGVCDSGIYIGFLLFVATADFESLNTDIMLLFFRIAKRLGMESISLSTPYITMTKVDSKEQCVSAVDGGTGMN